MGGKRKYDLLLLGGLLLAGALLLACLLVFSRPGAVAEVRVAGAVVETLPLDEDAVYPITGAEGGVNLLVISGGTARITEADCPDELCVSMGPISRVGQSIVCLPHQVVVQIVSGLPADGGVDAVTG